MILQNNPKDGVRNSTALDVIQHHQLSTLKQMADHVQLDRNNPEAGVGNSPP